MMHISDLVSFARGRKPESEWEFFGALEGGQGPRSTVNTRRIRKNLENWFSSCPPDPVSTSALGHSEGEERGSDVKSTN